MEYGGTRLELNADLAGARIHLQVDIGFGDVITPSADSAEYPVLLDHPAPHLRVYPRETVIAEKFQAMVYLGIANSRMKKNSKGYGLMAAPGSAFLNLICNGPNQSSQKRWSATKWQAADLGQPMNL
jgi:hypothetical protein